MGRETGYTPDEIAEIEKSRIDNPEDAKWVAGAEKKYRDLAANERESVGKTEKNDTISSIFDKIADSEGARAEKAHELARQLPLKELVRFREQHRYSSDPDDQKRVRLYDLAITKKKELEEKEGKK